MVTEIHSIQGRLLDENTLGKALATFDRHGVRFEVRRFTVGENAVAPMIVELRLSAESHEALHGALRDCGLFATEPETEDATFEAAEVAGVLPERFYSSTNFPTQVRIDGRWTDVENIEMDCGIRAWRVEGGWRAETCPMHRVKRGDLLVTGYNGVRVLTEMARADVLDAFRFMASDVSTERPKGRLIAECAADIRAAKQGGQKVLLVGGPAIIHSGCAGVLAELIEKKWIDVLFAGNALAAHDIEAAMLGTSLGIDLAVGRAVVHGHTHHLRAINRVRRCGSIRAAVEQGVITSGAMRACVLGDVPFVLAGSIRDDGPLPDVITDVVEAQDAMRRHVPGVGVALMVATTLHSVATGNMLPAAVKTYCVDSDSDSVIKLTDRGTHQAVGIVTDCEFFMKELLRCLAG